MSGLIHSWRDRLISDFGLYPVTAAEIEFYLHGSEGLNLERFWQAVRTGCEQAQIGIFKIEKEKGKEQHEVALMPENDPDKTARDVSTLKTILERRAEAEDLRAEFSAKPATDQPGSGLHIHIHLENADGKNVFYKSDERISDALKFSIGGLLACAREDMPIFAPTAQSRKRFVPGSNTPLTVSWGANNRTVAIRLPDSVPDNKRIEHRIAGADADPQAVMATVLTAIYKGLNEKIAPMTPQIYGDAALAMYDLPKLIP